MEQNIFDLNPKSVWKEFCGILNVPRPSEHLQKIRKYLRDWATAHSFPYTEDKSGNIIIRVPATPGMEDRKPIALQAHMDMVCEKVPSSNHNFENDPIIPMIENGWIFSKGRETTLGADNGIGMALAMAAATDPQVKHGPLEIVITADEEIGLIGAMGLDLQNLRAGTLINLDTEECGSIYVGCAGGMITRAMLEYKLEPAPKDAATAYRIDVLGLHGGHSGADIHMSYANANKLLARILWPDKWGLKLADYQGGGVHNAIPSKATAVVFVPDNFVDGFKKHVENMRDQFRKEFEATDPELEVTIELAEDQSQFVVDDVTKRNLLRGLVACSNGVIAMSKNIPNLVQTSTNLASCKMMKDRGYFDIMNSHRSSLDSERNAIAFSIQAVWSLAGASVEHSGLYPGWTPNLDSDILAIARESYMDLFHEEPEIKAIHAGVECGLFKGMDMISFGPTLKDVHTANECCKIATVEKTWKFLLNILERIPA